MSKITASEEGWDIAILGATGAVGKAIFETLAKRQFPVRKIFALARCKSKGKHQLFGEKFVIVKNVTEFDWKQVKLAFFAAGTEATTTYIEKAINSGCLVIDLSGFFSLKPNIPLLMPEINPLVLTSRHGNNIIAVPNSLTSQLLTVLKPLLFDNENELTFIFVTNLLSVSANGRKAIDALVKQSAKLLNGVPIDEDDFFGRQIAFNMLPMLPDHEGVVQEERRIIDEVRKILQNKKFMISANFIQSPVFYGHAQIVTFETSRPMVAKEVQEIFSCNKDILLLKKEEFLTQAENATGNTQITVSCISNNYGIPNQVQFWSVADNIYFGGALMAVKAAEILTCGEYLISVKSS